MVALVFAPALADAQDFTGFQIPAHRWHPVRCDRSRMPGPATS